MAWRRKAVNFKFLETLRSAYPEGFTTQQAQDLYVNVHSIDPVGYSDYMWKHMTARNAISASVYYGLLIRAKRGHYLFPERAESDAK